MDKATMFVFLVSIVQAISSLLFGYETAIVSSAQIYFNVEFGIEGDSFKQGLAVSEILVGCLIGALTGGKIADFFGRNLTLLGTDVIMTAFTIGTALAPSFASFVILRFFLGYPIGVISVVVPLYISEIAHKTNRGKVGVVTQLLINVGVLIAYFIGAVISSMENSWRYMIGIGFLFNILHFVLVLIIRVESPKWLIKKKRVEEARTALKRLRIGTDEAEIEEEIKEINAECFPELIPLKSSQKDSQGSAEDDKNEDAEEQDEIATDLKTSTGCFGSLNFVPVFITIFLNSFNQFSGINAIIYYCTDFFKAAGISEDTAKYIPIAVGVFNVVVTGASTFCVEKFGRRSLLLFSCASMALGHLVACVSFAGMSNDWGKAFSIFCIIGCMIYIFGFSIGMGPIPFIVVGEIFPSDSRALMMSFGLAGNWSTNLLISLLFPVFVDLVGQSVVFGAFFVFVCIGTTVVFIFLPETKGKGCDDNYANVCTYYLSKIRCVRGGHEQIENGSLLK